MIIYYTVGYIIETFELQRPNLIEASAADKSICTSFRQDDNDYVKWETPYAAGSPLWSGFGYENLHFRSW